MRGFVSGTTHGQPTTTSTPQKSARGWQPPSTAHPHPRPHPSTPQMSARGRPLPPGAPPTTHPPPPLSHEREGVDFNHHHPQAPSALQMSARSRPHHPLRSPNEREGSSSPRPHPPPPPLPNRARGVVLDPAVPHHHPLPSHPSPY